MNATIGNDSSVDWTSCSSVELLRLSKLSMVSRNEAMCLKERTKVHRNAKVNCGSIVSLERQNNFHHHEDHLLIGLQGVLTVVTSVI